MSLQKLTQKRVLELVRAGVPGEHRDAAARGLILRVRSPSSHSWSIRRHLYGRNHRLDLGDDWTLDEARDLAGEVERRVKAGCDPFWRDVPGWTEYFVAAKLKKHGIDPSALVDPIEPPPNAGRRMPEGPAMLWAAALESWIEHVASIRRPDTARSYRRSMRIAEMRAFDDRWVSEIQVEELAEAVYAIHRRGAERQSRATAIAVRLFFKWLGSASNRSRTGVAQYAMKELESPEFTNRATKKLSSNRSLARIPSGPEVGVIARGLRREGRTTERDRLAGLLVLYSCQRRRTVAAAERAQFESCGDLGGIWKMPPSHRKTAEEKMRRGIAVGDHVVPLPPQAWAVVKRAIALAGESP